MKPILKWAGGKTRMLKHVLPLVPKEINNYFEPFFGGGALYIKLKFNKAYINDINNELMNVYQVVKTNPKELEKNLKISISRDSEEYFYSLRESERKISWQKVSDIKKASRTIYLNKTCYGGLYRVNSEGYFNVPFAKNINGREILNYENISEWNKKLNNTKTLILKKDFEEIIEKSKKGDFIFVDPPYFPWSKVANFASYTKEGFGLNEQKRLRDSLIRADKRRVKFILTNSGTKEVYDFYNMFKRKKVPIVRTIANSKNKNGYFEYIVKNY